MFGPMVKGMNVAPQPRVHVQCTVHPVHPKGTGTGIDKGRGTGTDTTTIMSL